MCKKPYPIDLHQYEVGTLFSYDPARDWCRDGQAEIIEVAGRRWLVDTYWRDIEHAVPAEAAAGAVVTFVPSEHRRITTADAEVYGPERVVRVARHHGCYVQHYVRVDEPELTAIERARHALALEEQRRRDALDTAAQAERMIAHYRGRIKSLETAAA